jgi:LacI family transcriptional regulator
LPTLQELADQLGVSVATVSRALNDKPGVSIETRQRVLSLARELQYRPNLAARNLRTSQTYTVLFIVRRRQYPTLIDPFYPNIMLGLEEGLSSEGYSVMLVTLDDDQLAAGPSTIPALQEQRADGLVLAGPGIPPNFILSTAAIDLPTLLVDNTLQETPFPTILADNAGGCRAATNHLIRDHGHKKITLLRGPNGWISCDERAEGYLLAMGTAGLSPHIIDADDTTLDTGQKITELALEAQPDTTAIVASNDAMAIGAMRAARKIGRVIPNDLAVVGFDNISWAAFSDPPLTTVSIPTIEMGRLAARLLLERMGGSVTAPSRTTVATQLIIRSSCACSNGR